MSTAAALLLEKLLRDKKRDQMRAAIGHHFEVVPHRSWEPTTKADKVRRTAVYAVCARALGVAIVTAAFCEKVAEVTEDLGAVPVAPQNKRMFAFLRARYVHDVPKERERPRGPLPHPGSRQFEALRREWYAKAAACGEFEDIERPSGELKRLPSFDPERARINAARIERATTLYWVLERQCRVMELYALEGLDIRAIAERLGLRRWVVHRVIGELMGAGHRGAVEETSTDGDEDLDR